MSNFELIRTKQCANCPWKKSSDPHKIKEYVPGMHCNLQDTIKEGFSFDTLKIMLCHHDQNISGKEQYCIGWLNNQLGTGNNLSLRLKMRECTNLHKIKTVGEQHLRFQDTLPK